jgi:DNA-binding transcriptional LysR family regulator
MKAEPRLQIQLIVKEDDEIPPLLIDGKCDLALLQKPLGNPSYLCEQIGWERYVLAECTEVGARNDVILATDPTDDFAEQFFGQQKPGRRSLPVLKSFLFNEMGILRGVELGLGRSIIYEPLVKNSLRARVARGYQPLQIPILLHYHALSFHSKAISKVQAHIVANKRKFFQQRSHV